MVACHGKLALLLLDNEVVEILLQRELIAKSHAVVIDAEPQRHAAIGTRLVEVDLHLVIIVADALILAPHGSPSVVVRCHLRTGNAEAVEQVGLCHALAGVLVGCQVKAHVAGLNHLLALVEHLVGGTALLVEREFHLHVAIRREHLLGTCREHGKEGYYRS